MPHVAFEFQIADYIKETLKTGGITSAEITEYYFFYFCLCESIK